MFIDWEILFHVFLLKSSGLYEKISRNSEKINEQNTVIFIYLTAVCMLPCGPGGTNDG